MKLNLENKQVKIGIIIAILFIIFIVLCAMGFFIGVTTIYLLAGLIYAIYDIFNPRLHRIICKTYLKSLNDDDLYSFKTCNGYTTKIKFGDFKLELYFDDVLDNSITLIDPKKYNELYRIEFTGIGFFSVSHHVGKITRKEFRNLINKHKSDLSRR